MENKDIFDKIMELPVLRIFNPIYVKYKSILLYIFFGCVNTAANFITFYVLNTLMGVSELISNILAWVVGVAIAYVTMSKWCFTEHNTSKLQEIITFASGRVATLGLEELIILIFVTWLGYNPNLIKFIAAIFTTIANYLISKFIVFK